MNISEMEKEDDPVKKENDSPDGEDVWEDDEEDDEIKVEEEN